MTRRFWDVVLRLTPKFGRDDRGRIRNPLWHLAYSLWDDAAGCGCWRESKHFAHRWSR